MKRIIEIKYEWWQESSTGERTEVLERHVDFLSESAEDRIFEQAEQGLICGPLHDNIVSCDEDGEDGITYAGYWSINHFHKVENDVTSKKC